MRKLILIILSILMMITIIGCRAEREPATPPEAPRETVDYPYNKIGAENIAAIEIFSEGESTPTIEDEAVLQEVATLIQEAEFIEAVGGEETIEGQRGMVVYLKEDMLESNRVVIRHDDEKDRLYIGPQGREFLIRSAELISYLKNNLGDKFVIVEENTISQEARDWFLQFQNEKGGFVYQHPDATYIKVSAGERPTGGYRIKVRDFKEEEYPEEIHIEVLKPREGDMVIQVISFPTVYLKVYSEKATQYQVKTVDGEEYPMENKLIFAKLQEPEENSVIPNPVRVKGKIIAFEASFVLRILDDKDRIIHEEILQADHGGPNWGNFDEEISYPAPTVQEGSIELGEYSAKDGTYQLREKTKVRFK